MLSEKDKQQKFKHYVEADERMARTSWSFHSFRSFDVRLRCGQDGIYVGNDNETSTMTTILHYGSSPSIASWRV